MPLRRRQLLTTAAAVPLAATAGCTDRFRFADGTEARNPPAYARWVPATSPGREGTYFVYVDWTGTGDIDTLGDIPGGDVLARVASLGLFLTGFSYSRLGSYVFEDVGGWTATDVEQPDSATGQDLGTIERSLLCGAAVILEGEFDLDAIEAVAFDEGFERAGTHQESRVYEGSTFDTDLAFAARADSLVFGPDDAVQNADVTVRSIVERSLDVEAGDRQRIVDRSDDAEWAVGSAGHGQIALAAWGQFAEDSPFNDLIETSRFGNDAGATAVPLPRPAGEVYSVSLEQPAPSGDMAATYPDGNVPDRETVASTVGDRAHEQDVEIDDGRVSVSATWQLPTDTESSRQPRPRSHTGGQ
jgi:hypothetical protein